MLLALAGPAGNLKDSQLCKRLGKLCLTSAPGMGSCASLVDEGWYRRTALLNFDVFNEPKKNSNSTQIILGFRSR